MSKAKPHTVDLSGNLALRDAAGVKAMLQAALKSHASVEIATKELSGIDVSILQVLLAAHKTAVAAGKSLTLQVIAAGALQLTLAKAGFGDRAGGPVTSEGQFWLGSAEPMKGGAA